LHAEAFHLVEPAVFVAEERDGRAEELELDSLLLGVLDLFSASAKFGSTATEEDGGIGSHALRPAGGVHGGVATADDDGVLADVYGGLSVGLVGVHQVDAREEFIGGVNADQVFARHIEHVGQACAGAEEDGFIAFFVEKLVEGNAVADYDVGFELHAHGFEAGDFAVEDFARQSEGWDTIYKDTPETMQRLEDGDAIVALREDERGHQRSGAAPNHGDLRASRVGFFNWSFAVELAMIVGGKALKGSDRNRIELFTEQACALAEELVLADAAADAGKWAAFADLVEGTLDIALGNPLDE
jgi:hypothetical protein